MFTKTIKKKRSTFDYRYFFSHAPQNKNLKPFSKQFAAFALLLLPALTLFAGSKIIDFKYQSTFSSFDGKLLRIGTGKITRTWRWTGKGLVTIGLSNFTTGKQWCKPEITEMADWALPGNVPLTEAAINVTSVESDDEGFTRKHLELVAEIYYPSSKISVKYVVWAYPGIAGLRTQLYLKSGLKLLGRDTSLEGIPTDQIKILSASPPANPSDGAANLFDGKLQTVWRTKVFKSQLAQPNELILDLQKNKQVNGISIVEPQDYNKQGYVNRCIVYVSKDSTRWDLPVGTGNLTRVDYAQYVPLMPKNGRYLRIVMPPTSIVNEEEWSTQIAELKVYATDYSSKECPDGRCDYYPFKKGINKRRGIGYFGDTQFRNTLTLPAYREEEKVLPAGAKEVWDWNNILSVEDANEGVCLVKESQKTVLQKGHLTGSFIWSKKGLEVSGRGLDANEITNDYRECWANWCIVYQGGEAERQWAVKIFDRARFPIGLAGDKRVIGCTWGFAYKENNSSRDAKNGATEANVLNELKAAKKIGIETFLIDDGWQTSLMAKTSSPDGGIGWKPHPDIYPKGWKNIVNEANADSIRPALWAPIISWNGVPGISFDDLVYNQDRGKFINWKFDYAILDNYASKNEVESKIRRFITKYDHGVSMHLDLTENWPRYGFYWGRQYGTIWLENRRPSPRVFYTPSVILRDAWEISKYVNINKFQICIRNVDSVPPKSEGRLYNNAYATAISFIGVPVFFENLLTYSPESQFVVKNTIELYKKERDLLTQCYIFPVGQKPDNSSFTGFQGVSEDKKSGYLLLFREIFTTDNSWEYKLNFLGNTKIRLFNLKDKSVKDVETDNEGHLKITINNPADFSFYKYTVLNRSAARRP